MSAASGCPGLLGINKFLAEAISGNGESSANTVGYHRLTASQLTEDSTPRTFQVQEGGTVRMLYTGGRELPIVHMVNITYAATNKKK